MILDIPDIRRAYQRIPLPEKPWRFFRKHIRLELLNARAYIETCTIRVLINMGIIA